jgi:hypothetical protein
MTITVGEHWMHQRFVANLINASHSRELGEAAKEWKLYRYGYSEGSRCHLCNTQIKEEVELHNMVNKNILIIGHDCYDKLVGFFISGRVEHQLPDRKDSIRKLKEYTKKNLPNETVLGWLYNYLKSGRMPEDIVLIVRTIQVIGFAPSYAEADRLVEWYLKTRFHKILQPQTSINRDIPATQTPEEVMIAYGEKSYFLIKEGGLWRKYDTDFNEVHYSETILKNLKIGSKQFGLFLATISRVKGLRKHIRLDIIKEMDLDMKRFPLVDFNIVSKKTKNGYVGFLNGKVVLPNNQVKTPGTYKCFMLGEEGRYFRVWTLKFIRTLTVNPRSLIYYLDRK